MKNSVQLPILILLIVLGLCPTVWGSITNITTGTSGYASIQAAINAASTNDIIEVGNGNYIENLTIDKAIYLRSTGGASVTIIDGSGGDAASATIEYMASGAVLEGFTLTGGVERCIRDGQSGSVIENCDISNNNTTWHTIYPFAGDILNNHIYNNISTDGVITGVGGRVAYNLLENNNAANALIVICTGLVENNLIVHNTCGIGGILHYNYGTLRNNTVYGNTSGGNTFQGILGSVIVNNIDYGNSTPGKSGTDSVTYCASDAIISGTGNILLSSDPMVNAASGNYLLKSGSPCIDTGNSANAPSLDFNGYIRDNNPDIGAHEYSGILPVAFNITKNTTYGTIQAAINAASTNDIIEVSDGNYTENLTINKNITLRSVNGAAATTITGSGAYALTFGGTETAACIVQGFTITGNGGAVNGNVTQATIQDCIITGVTGTYGIYGFNGLCQRNTISNNTVSAQLIQSSDGSFIRNVITDNSAVNGWIYYYGKSLFENNLIANNNSAGGFGYGWGGIGRNNTFVNNTFWVSYNLDNGDPWLTSGSPPLFVNNICWGNTNNTLGAVYGTARVPTYCDGYSSGTGNINIDPNFVGSGDYSLNAASPCINAGDAANNPGVDITGTTRDSSPDMGAYELAFGTVTINESDGSTDVSEEGPTSDTYTVVLDSDPGVDVTVVVTPDIQTEVNGQGAGNPASLVLTAGNWSVPQTVTVTAIDDTVFENNHTSTITHTSSSTNILWNGISLPDVIVNVADNDNDQCGAWGYAPVDFDKNCYVDIIDLYTLAGNWLLCTDPSQAGCVDLGTGTSMTLQEIIYAASWGDEIIVQPGTYNVENLVIDRPVYLHSAGGASVTIIDGSGGDAESATIAFMGPGAILEGFTLTGGKKQCIRNGLSGSVIRNCDIRNNNTTWHMIYPFAGDILNNHIYNNAAGDGLVTGVSGRVAYNLIENNSATNALIVICSDLVENNLIVHNTCGAGILHYNSGTLRNNTIYANTSGGYTFQGTSGSVMVNNIDYGNSHPGKSGTDSVTYCASNAVISGMGNKVLSSDPMISAATGNYHLRAGSPCINAGKASNAPADDYYGQTRDANPDIGADEY